MSENDAEKGNLALTRLAEMAEQDGYLLLQYG